MEPTINEANTRRFATALESGEYEQCHGRLLGSNGSLCFEGVGAKTAMDHGARIRIGVGGDGEPRFEAFDEDGELLDDGPVCAYVIDAASEWLGWNLKDDLSGHGAPAWLQDVLRSASGCLRERGWLFNDDRVSLPALAALVRWHHRLDMHLVPGTPEHAEYQAHIDAQLDAWAADDANWRAAVAA